jgi:hypothetical protein
VKEMTYMTTKTCIKCGVEQPEENFSKHKNTKSGRRNTCKECSKIEKKAWVETHQEHIREYKRQDYANNAEAINEHRRERYAENPEGYREYWKQYREQHKEKFAAYAHKAYEAAMEKIKKRIKEYQESHREQTRAYIRKCKILRSKILKEVPCTLTPDDWLEALEYFNYACAYCGSRDRLTMDHIVPITKHGHHAPYNVIPACFHCNSSKNDSLLENWYPEQIYFSERCFSRIQEFVESKR